MLAGFGISCSGGCASIQKQMLAARPDPKKIEDPRTGGYLRYLRCIVKKRPRRAQLALWEDGEASCVHSPPVRSILMRGRPRTEQIW